MIKIEGLTKTYDDFIAVDGLSLEVADGQILGLVGPNGAGKTTTMRCLCGIIPPTSGTLLIDGYDLALDPVEAKRRLGFVPAEVRLFDHLTVADHLRFFRRLYAVGKDDPETDAQLLNDMELTEKKHQLPGALSRGMKQKLMIACALVHQPHVLIMDEPFTGLDPHAIRRTRTLLKNYADAGGVVLISSHLLGMVEDFVSRIMIIQHGQKIAEGTLAELHKGLPSMREDADLEEIFLSITSGTVSPAPPEHAP